MGPFSLFNKYTTHQTSIPLLEWLRVNNSTTLHYKIGKRHIVSDGIIKMYVSYCSSHHWKIFDDIPNLKLLIGTASWVSSGLYPVSLFVIYVKSSPQK